MPTLKKQHKYKYRKSPEKNKQGKPTVDIIPLEDREITGIQWAEIEEVKNAK